MRKKKGSNLSTEFRKTTEYVVCYRGGPDKLELYGVPAYAEKQVPLLNRPNPISRLKFGAGQVRVGQGVKDGPIRAQTFGDDEELQVRLHNDVQVKDAVITRPFEISGRFRWGQPLVNEELEMGSVFTASKTFRINVARHDQASKFKALASLITPDDGVGTNEDATEELRAILGDMPGFAFDYPKPTSLVRYLVNAACRSAKDSIVLDSFAGSGTTGHAVLAMNKEDGGNRRFILTQMRENDVEVAAAVTAPRLKRVIAGYHPQGDSKKEKVEATGGGFRYVTLGEPLFNERGQVRPEVKFAELAAHVFFTETGEPLPKKVNGKKSALIGACRGIAYYLLFNGVLGDKRPQGGQRIDKRNSRRVAETRRSESHLR